MRVLAALLAISSIAFAAPAEATNVVWVGGTSGSLGRLVPPDLFGTAQDLLGGVYQDDPMATVDYPGSIWPVTGLLDPTLGRSVGTGVVNAKTAITATSGPLVVIGASQGAMVVQQAEAELNSDPRVPSDTTFILIADPNFGLVQGLRGVYIPILDYRPAALPETRFNTIVVINQYDGFADPITRPWNLLTDLNALMGLAYVHPFAHNTDLSTVPADNVTTTVNGQNGTTTVYRVPTQHLPLTMPLRQLGVPDAVVDDIDSGLRPMIDRGYRELRRSPATSSPTQPTAAAVGRSGHLRRQSPTFSPAPSAAASTPADQRPKSVGSSARATHP